MPPKKGGKPPAAQSAGAASAAPANAAPATPSAGATAASNGGMVLAWHGEVRAVNTVPGRCSAVAAVEDQKLLVFGGWAGGTDGHVKDVHQLDLSTAVWSEIDASGEPHPGTAQAAAVDVGGALLFFGGWTGKKRTNETTLFQFDQHQWAPFATVGERPPALTFHTCSAINKRVYVYGGNTNDGQSGDMHILDLTATAWGTAATLGAPPKRSSHTATVVNDHMIAVFGGRGEDAKPLNDVAIFDASSSHWQINAKLAEGSPVPPARYGHSASPVGPNVIIFGGTGEGDVLLNDLWILRAEKTSAMLWQKVDMEGPPPSVRTGHSAVEGLSSMYVIGGRTDAFGQVSSQVYMLDTAAVAPLPSIADRDGDNVSEAPESTSAPPMAKSTNGPSTTPGTEISS